MNLKLALIFYFIRAMETEYTIITQCGCFAKGRSDSSILPITLKDCESIFSFVCCAAIKFSSNERTKQLCCLDKKDVQAPSFLDRCRLTSQQFDNIESIFGKSSVFHHRQLYTMNGSLMDSDEQFLHMYRSNMIFGAMTLVAFLCLVSLCFCSKFCQKTIIRRLNQVNEGARNEIMECYLLQNLNSQSILRDFNPYSPHAFAPPSYETLPKEPPRYSMIYLLEGETNNETAGTPAQTSNQNPVPMSGAGQRPETENLESVVVKNIQPSENKDSGNLYNISKGLN